MDAKTEGILTALEKERDKNWNISRETAQFLALLVKIKGAKNILEIGTSTGYSGIFLANAAKKNNKTAKVTTIEADFKRLKIAKQNFSDAKIDNIKIIFGEAIETTKKLKGKFDFVFIDANKRQYLEYLKNLEVNQNLKRGAVIIADNAQSHNSVSEYVKYVTENKKYKSSLVPIGGGEMISVYLG